MEKLTKEQKLEMVSKAIDAGFYIDLNYHSVKSDSELDENLSIFSGLKTRIAGIKKSENTWVKVETDDKFSAAIFIDSLRGDSND